jgi:pimeloyl-ACP methyl ester carboxylesterase
MPANAPHVPAAHAKANGIELCYDSFGDPSAPPLVLIMGLAAQMIAWDEEFCSRLAGRGYRVIRFDNRDVGLSTHFDAAGVPDVGVALMASLLGRPIEAPYRLHDLADDTAGLLDALGIDSAHVVGASMGGAVAQLMAIRHPERVRTLTSIMATTGEPGLPPPQAEAIAVLTKPTPTDKAAYVERYCQTWKVLRGGDFPEDEVLDEERALRIFERGLDPAGVARQLTAILASGGRRRELAAVRAPALVIHGDIDPLVPLACGIDTAGAVPGARLCVVEGMGHALPIAMWPKIIDAITAHAKGGR